MTATLKEFLVKAGRHFTPQLLHQMNATINYLEAGRWWDSHGFGLAKRVEGRTAMFDLAAAEIADKRVAYLEFGVWQGESMRYWSNKLTHPGSVLHGFDSFEGLPESWNIDKGKNAFSTEGQIPRIDDARVQFFKGWFDDTLPGYTVPEHDVLMLNLDADLYSSTRTVLNALVDAIKPGTYLYFDEFNDRQHELRAFDEFIAETGMKFRALGATTILSHALFQRVA